jgi:uncharacterized membrane protein YkvA (DUF1232 family)
MTPLHLIGALRRSLPAVVPLLRDGLVPRWLKFGALAAAIVVVSPLDPFADIPVLGALDDAVLLALLAHAFVLLGTRLRPREAHVWPATMPAPPALPHHARLRLRSRG